MTEYLGRCGHCDGGKAEVPLRVVASAEPSDRKGCLALDFYCPEGHFLTRSDGPEEPQRALITEDAGE